MPVYRAGELDQRIEIKREALTPDGMGGDDLALNTLVTTWAHVRPLGGSEREDWQQLSAQHAYLFVIRLRTDLQADDRIVWDGDEYNIRAIKGRGGRAMYLEIEAERGVAQ